MKSSIRIAGLKLDWQALLICGITAAAFWLLNALGNIYTTNIVYPLEIRYDHEKYAPTEPLPTELVFSATGTGWDLLRRKMRFGNDPLYINHEKLKQKKYITASVLEPLLIQKLHNLEIVSFDQDTIKIPLERLKEKKVKLVPDMSTLRFGQDYFQEGKIQFDPAYIYVAGTPQALKKLGDTLQVKFSISEITERYEGKVLLVAPDPEIELFEKETQVLIKAAAYEKVSRKIPVHTKGFPSNEISIDKEKVKVEYYVRKGDEEKDEETVYAAVADYSNLNKQEQTIKLRLQPKPSYVREVIFDPEVVTISE